jgi:hypothetical protein
MHLGDAKLGDKGDERRQRATIVVNAELSYNQLWEADEMHRARRCCGNRK